MTTNHSSSCHGPRTATHSSLNLPSLLLHLLAASHTILLPVLFILDLSNTPQGQLMYHSHWVSYLTWLDTSCFLACSSLACSLARFSELLLAGCVFTLNSENIESEEVITALKTSALMPNMFSIKMKEWALERDERSVSGVKRNGKWRLLVDCTKVEGEKKEKEGEKTEDFGSGGRITMYQATDGGRW